MIPGWTGYSLDTIVLWTVVAGGRIDTWLAPAARYWRRKRHRPGDTSDDAVQAAANAHVAINTPRAGLAIAIITPGKVRHVFAGHVDGKGSPAPDADTPFEIGSITKTFTAALLVALEREGKVTLDTRLDELLPRDGQLGRQRPSPVTLEHLAIHHAGLPKLPWGVPMLAGMYFTPWQPYRFISRPVWQRWLRHRRLRCGSRYGYSNIGYGTLGLVLARRLGLNYPAALETHLLRPLGLTHTAVTTHAGNTDTIAQPHSALGRRLPAWNLHALGAAGGIHSTLNDMTRWLQANMELRPPLDARLHTPRADKNGRGAIALGWHISGSDERRIVWHNGATAGSRSLVAFAPARGTGIVVLSNGATWVDALGMRLLRRVNQSMMGPRSAIAASPLEPPFDHTSP